LETTSIVIAPVVRSQESVWTSLIVSKASDTCFCSNSLAPNNPFSACRWHSSRPISFSSWKLDGSYRKFYRMIRIALWFDTALAKYVAPNN
jgi:hypothetical protein